jgi:hypothetical protein
MIVKPWMIHHRREGENHQGAGDHAGDRLPRPALAVQGEPLDEDRNERGAGDAAEHEVKEHVGHRVGEVEGVGDRCESEHPRQDQHAQQSGQSRRECSARHGKDA